MLFALAQNDRLGRLHERLRRARAITPGLVADVLTEACVRAPAINAASARAGNLRRLIEARAWTDAGVALIELELPQWRVRRLVCEDGQWLCSLTRHWQAPDWLDDMVEASHAVLPIAILMAFLQAQQDARSAAEHGPVPAPRLWPDSGVAVWCDDFA
jgi:hypothetical protein